MFNPFYKKTIWRNLPETSSAVNARNLNNIEEGIETLDARVSSLSEFETEDIDFDKDLLTEDNKNE